MASGRLDVRLAHGRAGALDIVRSRRSASFWGYGDRPELESARAVHIVASPADLIPIAETYGASLRPK
jgi:hypothetical protein